jgi:hypothetical protein
MTLRSILAAAALAAIPTLGVLRPAAAMPLQTGSTSSDLYDACIQECFDHWIENKEKCKKSSKICAFSILWMCASSYTNQDMLEKCVDEADAIYAACKAACKPQP